MPLPAIFVLAASHAFDYVSFLFMTARHGLAAELNPIAVVLAMNLGLPGLTVAKAASVIVAVSAAVIIARRRPRMAASVMIIGTIVGMIGGFSNVATWAAF